MRWVNTARAGLLAISSVLLAPTTARAHPHEGPAYDSLLAALRAERPAALGLPDPARATAIAAAATLMPLGVFAVARDRPTAALAAAGLIAGPVVGFAHGGIAREAAPAAALRGVLMGAAVAGTAVWWRDPEERASVIGVSWASLALASAVWDVVRTRGRVARSNDDAILMRLSGARVIVTPDAVGIAVRF